MTRAPRMLLAAVIAGALSCGDEGTGSRAGMLEILLATPNAGADGAILFTVVGPAAPAAASAPTGLRVFHDSLGTVTTFAVTGTLPAGTIARILVDDPGRAGEYTAVVQQVAAADYTLRPLAGYTLTVAR
ncbi:MAG TPA: hypothetical protein VD707_06970 [Gemmatimonadales bacterium]|nr:hypothetical protein [Gemmatimonadales bacterium]